jgi:hypothetical protein
VVPEFENGRTRPAESGERASVYETAADGRVATSFPRAGGAFSTARRREGGDILSVFRIAAALGVGRVL